MTAHKQPHAQAANGRHVWHGVESLATGTAHIYGARQTRRGGAGSNPYGDAG